MHFSGVAETIVLLLFSFKEFIFDLCSHSESPCSDFHFCFSRNKICGALLNISPSPNIAENEPEALTDSGTLSV